MSKISRIQKGFFLLTVSFVLFGPVQGKAEPSPELTKIRNKMAKLIKASGVPEKNLSLYVLSDDEKEKPLVDVNSASPLIAASISKIATTSAVLDAFPPGTRFKTQIFAQGKIQNNELNGDLVLKGGGDPSFVSENLWFLVNHFVRSGIQSVKGDILVDDTMFDAIRFDESREDSRVDRAYDAPVGAMSLNWNSVNIFIRPTKKGDLASVYLDPENGYLKLSNKVRTVSGSGQNISVDRVVLKEGAESFTVSGTIGAEAKEFVIYKNIQNPDLWAGENLKSFLAQRGVHVSGQVRRGTLKSGELVAEYESKSIDSILADMNKFSNNYVAEMLAKNLAATQSKPAALSKGIEMIQKHLQKIGLESKEYVFVNPSGLTRENKFSARAMLKILTHLRKDFRVQPEFLTSLPIAGVDGTLKKRMTGANVVRQARAKTGLLTGVAALAGYAASRDGQVYTFVFIHNGTGDESRFRRLFDEWVEVLVE